MLAVIVGGLIGYMGLVNRRAVSGYKISSLTQRINELEALQEKLELGLTEARHNDKIKQRAEELHLVVLSAVEYLEKSPKNLARR